MGAVRPERHFFILGGGGKIDVIPKNKNREDVKKRSAKKWGGGAKKFLGVKEFLGGQKIFRTKDFLGVQNEGKKGG